MVTLAPALIGFLTLQKIIFTYLISYLFRKTILFSKNLIPEIRAIDVATHIPPEIINLNLSPDLINKTRRIINGEQVTDNRPYMVSA